MPVSCSGGLFLHVIKDSPTHLMGTNRSAGLWCGKALLVILAECGFLRAVAPRASWESVARRPTPPLVNHAWRDEKAQNTSNNEFPVKYDRHDEAEERRDLIGSWRWPGSDESQGEWNTPGPPPPHHYKAL